MRILVVLTYYRPHTSGLTIYAERLAKAWVRRGHQVTVLTSAYKQDLPSEEIQDGVRIVRAPVLFRVSKGVIMPSFIPLAWKLAHQHDAIQLHLPQFDAAAVALFGRLLRIPTVITYHCDLRMPPGLLSWLANLGVKIMNNLAAILTQRIVTYTRDYAENSRFLRRYLQKLHVISPPVELPYASSTEVGLFANRNNPANHRPVIGMAARFATEKGVEVLLNAMPQILEEFPNTLVLFAGPYQNIIGEENYFNRLAASLRTYEQSNHWLFLGELNPQQISAFYQNIDVLVLPSLNSTEAFGLVQIEAMIHSKPGVASNLPGVRQPVKRHGMGRIATIGSAESLASEVITVLQNPEDYQGDLETITREYLPDTVAEKYEELFKSLA